MNKIYKVVWNTVRNCYVVGSELISSKSGRHSTSNGKSSSLKVTLTVLALCGMTALGSGVVPAYAADAGTAVESQYVAVLVNKENNSSRNTRTFDGYRYHKETVSDQSYWVRDGYTIKYEENERYPGALKDNIIKAYKNDSYTASSDAGLLKSNQIMVESAGVSTLTGVNLDDVSGGTYVGATNSGSTSTPSSFNYMIKDDNGTYVDAGKTNFSKRFKAATKNTDGTYSYKGEVIANDNLYVVDNTVGVFLTSSGKVYTGKVFGANNEVLMTTKSDSGTMYSYWGADTPDPNTKLADMTIGQFNQALEKVNNNSKAVAGDTIKEIKTTAKTDGGTIDLVRRGQYNSATGQYEGEHKVGSGITITSHGGTNGEDVKINFSNGTTGFDVAAGSKVEAVKAMDSATDITGLTINGETYNIKTGQNYTAGDNVSISADNVISATNTTLVAGDAEKQDDSYIVKDTAGNEVVLKDVASVATVTNNYTTLDAKIDNTKTTITNEYNTAINNAKTHYYSVNSDETGEGSNYNNDGAIGLDSIAVGANAYANGRIGASAFGNDAYANGERALAVGNGSKAQGLAAIAIGTGDSRYGADGTNAIAVGEQSYAKGDYTTAIGGYSKAVADKATAFGHQAVASGSASTAIGMQSQALGTQSTAIGDYSNAQGTATAAFGGYSKTTGDFATSLGYTSESVIRGTAVGAASSVTGEMGTAVGLLSSASVWGGVALGGQSSADTEAGVTGYSPNAVEGEDLTSPTWTSTLGAVSVGTAATVDEDGTPVAQKTRQITNLAAGTVDTDAVNVAQLKKARVELTDGTHTTVKTTHDQTDGHVIYSVDVDTSGKIEQNNTNIVTGDTVYNALQDVSWTAKVNGQVAKPVKKDDTLNFINGDNIAITSNNNGDIKISTTGLASSGDLWTAQAGGKDVTAVNQKVNFNSTDKHLVVESTKDGEITFATKDLADTSFTNITKEGNTYIKNLAKGEDRHIEAKEYAVGNDGSVTMTYVDGNGNTIDGTAKITGIAKSDLSNITNKGNTVINNIAKNAVKVIGGTNTAVETSTTDNGPVEYKVNLNKDVNLGDTIQLNGSDGSISAKSGGAKLSFGNNGLTVSQAKNGLTNETRINGAEITVDGGIGNQTTIKGSTARIGNVLVNGGSGTATITGLTNKTTDYTGFANGSGRAATEEQLKEVDSKAAAAKTTVTNGKNITVDEAKADDGSSTYTVGLATDVVLGDNAIKLNGSDGSISAKSGGAQLAFNNSGLTVSQAKNGLTNETRIDGATITVDGGTGNQTIINGSTARIGSVLVNGGGGTATITGLTNKTTDYTGFANGSGRAATEEQLKEVAGKAGEAIETAGKGWNLTTNGKESSKTNIKPDGTVDFSSGNDNLVISNAGANLSFSLSDNLDLTNNKDKKGSVKVGENTALTDELLQVGKDVSLTASALNVGNSSLTTSALTVGNSMLTTDALTVGGHSYITSSGINANNMRITNVAAGINGTDAVNVNQLKSAISGSQVSIDAGTGIIVEKTGNKYTIKTNIEGLSNDHGTVTVSTNKDSALVTDSGASMPAHAKRMNLMLMADDLAEVPETTTLMGDTLYVKHSANSVKLITDEIANHEDAVTLNDGEKIDFVGGKNIKTFSEHGTDANGKNYDKITFSLKDDISVTSVTTDKVTINNGPTINSSGINMNNQKITNLKDGEIAEGSKDAVNGGQIYDLKQNVSTNTENINILNEAVVANAENINSLSHSLNKLDSRINRVGAGAAALAALHPLDFDPDNKWDFAAGYGNYAGANAVAIGTYYRPNENTMFSIGGSFGGGENMINAGVSFKLGSGSSGITTSKTVMAKKIKEQDELLKAQDAKMKEQDEKIAKLEALVAQQGEMIQQALGKK